MEISESTRILFEKIQRYEPEYALRIISNLLRQHGEQEIAYLASLPDHVIYELSVRARIGLEMLAARSAISTMGNPSPASFQVQSPFYNMHDGNTSSDFTSVGYTNSITDLFGSENHRYVDSVIKSTTANFNLYNNNNYYLGYVSRVSGLNRKNGKFPFKTCYYFSKGFCRHGNSCRFYHNGQAVSELYGNDIAANDDDQVISLGSLAKLESEIVELLKQRGSPISIASLPMAYYDKYKKALQAEGYQAESQRHGKSGCNLTRLLIRLGNSIRLIDRPHGQHSVVLAEDAAKFMGRADCQHISASQQLYLTFPADSTFSEDDVSNYFRTFGCVIDVRIPCQSERMFGFVTFVYPETVKTILEEGNPHYVRGSRVLVKPYKERAKLVDRKYPHRFEHHVRHSPEYVDFDAEITSSPIGCGNTRYQTRLQLDEQNRIFELQRRRLAMLQVAQRSLSSPPHLSLDTNGSRVSDDNLNVQLQPTESFSYARNVIADNSNEDREGVHQPETAFAFRIDTGISAIM
ncbi:zinc finger CCCH domain-containing protein 18-like isoform X2 [Vicia villosa]|uniref:zinc finger CCCH domain-containing protein 18-like isoform X2 n=1 Tax=Vicia villosa TaxID=3911 RepID=UPI00273C7133|nr:zinc finger CCCH domain-containing protein 18-like isoform X2 [Vicia villosa]